MSNIIDSIQLSGTVYTLSAQTSGGIVSSAITSGDTNAVAGGAVYDKFDEVEQVTARALNSLSEADEVTARALIDLNSKIEQGGGGITSGEVQTMIDESVSGKVNTSSVVSAVTSASTDSEIPTAKAVFDALGSASGGGTIDSAITSGSSNAVESSAIWSATTYNKQIELKYDATNASTNFPSGCTKIAITNISNYSNLFFLSGNNRLGSINITNYGSINVSNSFTDSTYTISGNTVTVTWPEGKNVTKLVNASASASASVYAIIDGVFVNEHSYMDIEVDEKLAKKLDSSAYTPIYVDSELNNASTNPVQNKVLYRELRYVSGKSQNVNVTFDATNSSTNFPSGCTKIDVDVTNFQQYVSGYINFYNGNNRLGFIGITKTYNGSINVSNSFTDSTYTVSGNTVMVTWPEEKNVTKLQVDGSATSVYAYGGNIYIPLIQQVSANTAAISGIEVSSAITSGDTNAVAGGAVYDKFDEVEQVTARALNSLSEADEVTARALIDLNSKIEQGGGGITSGEVQTMIDESVSGKVNTSSVVSAVTSASTDSEIPTAKAVYDAIPTGGGKAISAGTNISVTTGETADTVSCTLPIYFNSKDIRGDIAIGTNLTGASSEYYNLLIGRRIEIGSEAYCKNNIGIGYNTSSNSAYKNTIYGNGNVAIGDNFEIGTSSYDRNDNCVVIGYSAKSKIDKGVAIGLFTVASGTTKTNINNQLTIDTSNQVYIYNKDNTEMICLQDNLGGGSITIDPSLDSGSTNPVANSAITTAINAKADTTAVTQAISEAVSGKSDTTAVTQAISEAVSGKADTSAVTAVQDSLSGYVTTNTMQEITSSKRFVNIDKGIIFKQADNNSKIGFSLQNSAQTNNELASFELRPNTYTDSSSVRHPLLYLGHYRRTAIANAGVPQTMVGFRQYDQLNAAAYHYLMPLPAEAKTPFSLTTSFKNFFATLGFKNGSTMITTDNTGVADFSSVLGGLKLQKLTQVEYDALTTKDDNTVYFIGDSTNGYTMKIGSANVN